jgi:hypothetical protein
MTTKRRTINRPTRRQISPEAIAAWRELNAIEDVAVEEWWDAHRRLHRLLGMKPWHWPCAAPPRSCFNDSAANLLWEERGPTKVAVVKVVARQAAART